MPESASTRELLRTLFQKECDWLQKSVDEMEMGRLRMQRDGRDVTSEMMAEYRHRVGNLLGNMMAYERICERRNEEHHDGEFNLLRRL
jgi:hypothetical protein